MLYFTIKNLSKFERISTTSITSDLVAVDIEIFNFVGPQWYRLTNDLNNSEI